MEQEEKYMVCVPVDELDDPQEGSTQTACVDCGRSIWISPESRKEMYDEGAMPMCSHCGRKQAETRPVEHRGRVAREMGMEGMRGPFDQMIEGMRQAAANFTPPGTDVFEVLKSQAALAGQEMRRPSDDWGSLVVMENFEGVTYPPLPLGKMLDVVPKEVIATQLLPALAYTAQAKRVIFGISSWSLAGEKDGPPLKIDGPISEHPDRIERLVLIDVDADGVQRMAHADITRDGVGPPRLGEWHDTEKPEASNGLFVDALVPALHAIRAAREGSLS